MSFKIDKFSFKTKGKRPSVYTLSIPIDNQEDISFLVKAESLPQRGYFTVQVFSFETTCHDLNVRNHLEMWYVSKSKKIITITSEDMSIKTKPMSVYYLEPLACSWNDEGMDYTVKFSTRSR